MIRVGVMGVGVMGDGARERGRNGLLAFNTAEP